MKRKQMMVGTSRCDVPARAAAGGMNPLEWVVVFPACGAERGVDGAARRPYLAQRQTFQVKSQERNLK
jgi:hypothetical protein